LIALTRLNHKEVVLNSDLIEIIETTPDTVITLTTGQKLMVLESSDEVVDRIVTFRQMILKPGQCVHLQNPDREFLEGSHRGVR
jgi:flagellar protein FlbD